MEHYLLVSSTAHNQLFLMFNISRVPDQNGVSQAWYIAEIHHSGRKPLICKVIIIKGGTVTNNIKHKLSCSKLFYSILCPSTAVSSPLPVLQLSLSFAFLVNATPCCPTMSSLQCFGLTTDLTPFICHSVLLIAHLLSIPFSYCIGYILDYVCHSFFA